MIYGYARISAKTQLKGNSLEEQRTELTRNGCEIIIEEQFTGKTTTRPKFKRTDDAPTATGRYADCDQVRPVRPERH